MVERLAGSSRITQRITLAAGRRSLGISTEVDWQEREKLLKLGFPLDVRADRSAAETQFGHVFRPTHVNTSWEAAKFEICAHRWIHVAEPGYGVAIANASTYGHDVARTCPGRRRDHHHRPALAAARGQVPGPPGRPGRHVLDVCDPARRGHRRRRRGGLPHQPGAADGAGAPTPSSRWSPWTTRPWSLKRSSWPKTAPATSSSGCTSHWASAPPGALTANFPATGSSAVDLLERPVDAAGCGGRARTPPSSRCGRSSWSR